MAIVVVSNSRFAPEAQWAVGPIDTCIWCRTVGTYRTIPEGEGESLGDVSIDSIKCVRRPRYTR